MNSEKLDADIRILTEEHLASVAEIEALSFSEPWSKDSLSLLCKENNFGVVATVDGRVVAYGGMTVVLDEGSVTNIATHPSYRGMGLGRSVVKKMLSVARERAVTKVYLEVRYSNSVAISLYTSEGFSSCGIRKNFYKRPVEDAILMVRDITN